MVGVSILPEFSGYSCSSFELDVGDRSWTSIPAGIGRDALGAVEAPKRVAETAKL